MVVSEKPVFEAAAFSNFIKEVRQDIPLVQSTTECILDAAEAAVGYDVIYILTNCPAFLLLSGILPRWAVPLSIRKRHFYIGANIVYYISTNIL